MNTSKENSKVTSAKTAEAPKKIDKSSSAYKSMKKAFNMLKEGTMMAF